MNLKIRFQTKNDCYRLNRKMTPVGIIVHSTGCKGLTAEQWAERWDGPGIEKCVHAFVDNDSIVQTLPWNVKGWHAGGTANGSYIGFEIAEPDDPEYGDPAKFRAFYDNALNLCEYLCRMYKIPSKKVICHAEGHRLGIASNHGDVEHWWPIVGKSMSMFRATLAVRLGEVVSKPLPVYFTTGSTKDTLYLGRIAKRFGVPMLSIRRVVSENPEKLAVPNPLAMKPGMKLRIK